LQGPSCTQAQTAAGPHHAQTAAGAHSFLFGFVKHGVVRGSLLTNRLEKLTELSANAGAIAEELEKIKKELAKSRAELSIATMKSPLVAGSAYPLGLDSIVIGTSVNEVQKRLPGVTWDPEVGYIPYRIKNGSVFSGATYYFDSKLNVSAILYHFRDSEMGSELVQKLMLTGFGEPIAQKKDNFLWKLSNREWVSIIELGRGTGKSYMIDATPSTSLWGDIQKTGK
ncbi:hypothetical protein, partial [Acidovorax sp. SUPP1855]|uniref:hypothetical protein n=1 Tax=Acidovorax sp. SUPP1855 TaxID=431774 RepID=UPI0024E0554E